MVTFLGNQAQSLGKTKLENLENALSHFVKVHLPSQVIWLMCADSE